MIWSPDHPILLTGGGGFLGTHLCEVLRQDGHRVAELPPIGEYEKRDKEATVLVPRSDPWDLTREHVVHFIMDVYRPSLVIHLAALCGGIGLNRAKPGELFYKNLIMGTQLMEGARKSGTVKKFVAVGTVCAYPKHTTVPFKEEDLWEGYPEETNAPYGLAKKMLLVQAQAYRQQYGFNAIYLLPVNLYGPGDNFDPGSSHVIPALIQKAIYARDHKLPCINVWGTGVASREFLYVRDCAEAIWLATRHYDSHEPVNIGAGSEVPIKELVETICDLVGYEGKICWDATKPDGQPRRKLDTSRARQFGFTATTSMREGLLATIQWYQDKSTTTST